MAGLPQVDTILNWLRRTVHPRTGVGMPIREIKLRHVGSDRAASECSNYPISAGDEVDLEALAREIYQDAVSDAEAFSGVQTYAVQSFFGESEQPKSRITMRIQSEEDLGDGDQVTPTEPTNEKGLMGQLMRHSEAATRIALSSAEKQITQLNRTIERLSTQLERRDQLHFETIEASQELMNMSHAREMESQKRKRKDDRTDKMLGEFMRIAGSALPKLLHGSMPAISPPPSVEGSAPARASDGGARKPTPPPWSTSGRTLTELLKEVTDSADKDESTPVSLEAQVAVFTILADTVQEEQFEPLMGVLTPEQIRLFFCLFKVNKASRGPVVTTTASVSDAKMDDSPPAS